MSEERTIVAVCRVRGLFSLRQAKRREAKIAKNFAKRGLKIFSAVELKSPASSELSLLVTCDQSVEQQVKEKLGLLNFNFKRAYSARLTSTLSESR